MEEKPEQKEYVSIFDEERYERNSKLSDEVADASISNKKKKIKNLQNKAMQKSDDKLESLVQSQQEKVVQKIDITVIDYETPKRFQRLKTLQNLVLWFFCKNQVNPLWIMVHNKHLIRCGAVMLFKTNIVEFENALSVGKYEFLSQHYKKEKMVYFRDATDIPQDQQSIWSQVFSSRVHDEPSFKALNGVSTKIDRQKIIVDSKYYQNTIKSKYDQYILTAEQQKMNLYPVRGMTAYRDYIDLCDNEIAAEVGRPLKIIAIDCEMVQTELGLELARVTIVDFDFNIIMDEFVMPANHIKDYNTKWSGITESILQDVTTTIEDIQLKLRGIVDKHTIIIGHSLENDLHALKLIHDNVIDTSVLYMTQTNRKLSLKALSLKFLNLHIQKDTHDSTEDAKIALGLARHRIDLLENFSMSSYHSNSSQFNPDVLLNLNKMGGVHIVENQDSLEQFPKTSMTCESAFMNECEKLDKVKTLMAMRAGAPKVVFCEFLEQNCGVSDEKLQELDGKLRHIYDQAPLNTVMVLSFQNETKEFPLQSSVLERPMNAFFMFLTK